MRFFIPLLAFMVCLPASALTCMDPSAGLSLSVSRSRAMVHLRFSAGRGYASIPQIEGPVGEQSLPMMKFQFETLRELGDAFEFQIPAASCDLARAADGIFSCYKEVEIKGKTLKVHSLTSYQTKQLHTSGDFKLQTFRMLIGTENLFFFALPFPAANCTGSL